MGSLRGPYDHSPPTRYNGNPAEASAYRTVFPTSSPMTPHSMTHRNIARPPTPYDAYPQDNTSEFLQGEFERRTHASDQSAPGSSVWITLFNLLNHASITSNVYQVLTDATGEWDEDRTRYITNLRNLHLVTPDEYNFYMSSKYTAL